MSNALFLLKWWMGPCAGRNLLKKRCFSVTVPVQYMSCWTGLNVFDHVCSYGNPLQQTDSHMKLYQKLCAGVNSRFAIFMVKKLELKISLYEYGQREMIHLLLAKYKKIFLRFEKIDYI